MEELELAESVPMVLPKIPPKTYYPQVSPGNSVWGSSWSSVGKPPSFYDVMGESLTFENRRAAVIPPPKPQPSPSQPNHSSLLAQSGEPRRRPSHRDTYEIVLGIIVLIAIVMVFKKK